MSSFGLFPWDSSLVFSPAKQVEFEVGGGNRSVSRSPCRSPVDRSRSRSPISPVDRSLNRSPVYRPRRRSPVPVYRPRRRSRPVCRRSRPVYRRSPPVYRRSPPVYRRSPDSSRSSSESPDPPGSRRCQLPINNIHGTKVDIVSLLCSSRRDYLVDKDGDKTSVSSLVNNGKYLIICCFEVPVESFSNYGEFCWALKSALSTPLWSNHCQLILALKIKSGWKRKDKFYNNYLLNSFLSAFPNSLAIPFWDSSSYHRLFEFLRPLEHYAPAIVLDPDHNVLNQYCRDIVEHGPDSFPFTTDHLSNLINTNTVFNWSKLRPVPLEDVLGLRPTDSLSNLSATATVSVSDLKHKLVGLYLFCHGNLSSKINTIYKQCQTNHRELEIVVVYLSFNDNPLHFMDSANGFLKKQGISSWWVLPFDYSTSRRLWNLCCRNFKDELVIVGPQGQFFERKGDKVITEFDPVVYDMYPYAAEAIAKRETSRLQNLTLESLLFSEDEEHDDYLLTRKGHRINVKELRGKRVLLFSANLGQGDHDEDEDEDEDWCSDQEIIGDWCKANRKYYIDNNKSGEIILVLAPLFISNEELLDSKDSMPWLWDSKMPWLICPPDDPVREARLFKDTTLYGFDIVDDHRLLCFTFREDGRMVSKVKPRQLSQHNWADDKLYAQILYTYTDKLDYDSKY